MACGRRILPKAETLEQAAACLNILSGRAHRVYGGICLCLPDGQIRTRLSVSQVKFRVLDKTDKQAYLASGEWQGKAGGYAIQGRAGLYIRQITGSYSNIVGLDMHHVAGLLLAAGFTYAKLADGLLFDYPDHPRLIAVVEDSRVTDLWAEQDALSVWVLCIWPVSQAGLTTISACPGSFCPAHLSAGLSKARPGSHKASWCR